MSNHWFILDTQIESGTHFVCELELCQVRLHNNFAYPWFLLIPKRHGIKELFELTPSDQSILMSEICRVSKALYELYEPDKLNVGAIGNIVSQLHIHIIVRYKQDDVWPDTVWNKTNFLEVDEETKTKVIHNFISKLEKI